MLFVWSSACSIFMIFGVLGYPGVFRCAGMCAILMTLEFLEQTREDR